MRHQTRIALFAAVLFSTFLCFAQSNTNNSAKTTDNASSTAKMDCPCCKAMAESKDGKTCCQHDSEAKDGKGAMSCCQGKDGMACMKGDKNQSATAACADCCKKGDQKGCCAKSDKTPETAMACCGSDGGHCGMQHHDHDISK